MKKTALIFLSIAVLNGMADEKEEFKKRYHKEGDIKSLTIQKGKIDVEVLQDLKKANTEDEDTKKLLNSRDYEKEANKDIDMVSKKLKSQELKDDVINNKRYIINDDNLPYKKSIEKYTNHKVQDVLKKVEEQKTDKESDERIYVFISSSLQKSLIQNYFKKLQNVNKEVVFILRGTIGGVKEIMPTMKWISEMLTKEDGSRYSFDVYIDPDKTIKHNIEAVPAVLYTFDKEDFIVYGGVDVQSAIEKINRSIKSKFLEDVVTRLKKPLTSIN